MDLRSVLFAPLSIGQERFFTKKRLESQPNSLARSGARRSLACHQRMSSGVVQVEELEDSTIVDMQEGSNGYLLFKFGTTQVYDDPPRFISAAAQSRPATFTELDDEVIDCSAVVYRLPNDSISLSPFKWGDGYKPANATGTNENETFFEGPPFTQLTVRTPLGLSGNFMRPYNLESFGDQLSSYEDAPIPNFLYLSSSSNSDMAKLLPIDIGMLADIETCAGTGAPNAMMTSTVRRADRSTKKAKLRHKRASKVGARDLYKSNSFQMYELIFSYPFLDSNKASTSWKGISKEKYTDLVHVLNQVAVGLAGGGLALVLFVASRMLCLNATLDGAKLMTLLRGVGLIWLSSAFQKFGSVVRQMAECDMKARQQRKEHVAMFRKQVHAVTFQMCTMVMLSMVRLV